MVWVIQYLNLLTHRLSLQQSLPKVIILPLNIKERQIQSYSLILIIMICMRMKIEILERVNNLNEEKLPVLVVDRVIS